MSRSDHRPHDESEAFMPGERRGHAGLSRSDHWTVGRPASGY